MDTADLDYTLPEKLIAQRPAEKRDESRLLVVERATGAIHEDVFRNLPAYLRHGDALAMNDTRVIRARLHGVKPTGGRVELFLLREVSPRVWEGLVRPSARVQPDTRVALASGMAVTVGEVLPGGKRRLHFDVEDVPAALEAAGEVPLPPYIHREHPDDADLTRYQTLYARAPGAVAAPTAGLHYTDEVFRALESAGIQRAYLTLHVGYGTFRPILAERVEEHRLEPERFELPRETAAALDAARASGGRIVAVGTTVTRVLETQFRDGRYAPGRGETAHYIHPPYTFRAIDALQTNFHLPRSSLLALVCAFAGRDLVFSAYRFAIERRFRFYSYGDTMLIL